MKTMGQVKKAAVIAELQKEILRMQGLKPAEFGTVDLGLGPINEAFPNACFPLGAIHEFVSQQPEDAAATSGFITGLLSSLMGNTGTSLWISSARTIFPPALTNFGVQPDRIIFIDLQKEKEVLWVMEEALRCGSLAAVVGELREISFIASRRLQLAVEQSKVTGFLFRHDTGKISTTACVSRWRITSLPSQMDDDLPGIGFPQWKVELLKIKNGRPGTWSVKWVNGKFQPLVISDIAQHQPQKKAG